MLQVAWFTTARGQGSRNLFTTVMDHVQRGDLDLTISVVVCNREPGEAEATDSFFDLVKSHGIPLITLSSVAFRKAHGGRLSRPGEPLPEWRTAYDDAIVSRLASFTFDVGVLAGYMLITTERLCDRYSLLNLHPAAPGGPEGVWQDVIRRLISERSPVSGVQIQRATSAVDRGPIVSFCTYPIQDQDIAPLWAEYDESQMSDAEGTPLFLEIRGRGMAREAPLMVETLRAFAEGRVSLRNGIPQVGGRPSPEGIDLTKEVESSVNFDRD